MVLDKKKNIRDLIVFGNPNSGRSTLTGHLIFQFGNGSIGEERWAKLEKEAEMRSRCKFALLIDKYKAQMDRHVQITQEIWQFSSDNSSFSIVNTPGHQYFITNLIVHSIPSVALLVIDSTPQGFSSELSENSMTKTHLALIRDLGILNLVICLNKFDDPSVNFSQTRYNELVAVLTVELVRVGLDPRSVPFVPVAGLSGINFAKKSSLTQWYSGDSLLASLDLASRTEAPENKPLRIPVEDVYKIGGVGTVPVGRVEYGRIVPEMPVFFAPVDKFSQVRGIEANRLGGDFEGVPGDNIGFSVKRLYHHEIHRGCVCSDPSRDPAREALSFEAIIALRHPPNKISKGYTVVIDCHTAHIACQVAEIYYKIDRRSGRLAERSPKFLTSYHCAKVKLIPQKPLCVEAYRDYPTLGLFAIRDMRMNIGHGIVTTVEKKPWIGKLN